MIRLVIPVLAFLIAFRLYLKRPTIYVSYTMWAWFLTPLIRRLVDWRLGWADPNYILLTPMLVSFVGILSIVAPSKLRRPQMPPAFLFCGAGVLYGFMVGMLLHPSQEVIFGLFNWLTPLLFGVHLAVDWRNYESNRAVILKTFVWGAGLMGIYGVYQFLTAPLWDVFWLQNVTSGLTDPSFGRPEPMMMRIWSTLNAPGPFAGAMASALLFMVVARSRMKVPFSIAGYTSFLLTGVRAAWLGYAIGLVMLLRKLNPQTLIKIVASMVVVAGCMIPIVMYSSSSAVDVSDRLKSLTELKNDTSFQDRQEMYGAITQEILHSPFGMGLQNQQVVRNLPVDSGIMMTLLSLGWLGTALYMMGVALAMMSDRGAKSEDTFIYVCKAVCWSSLAQYLGANMFVGLASTIFWVCAGSIVASASWERHQQLIESSEQSSEQYDGKRRVASSSVWGETVQTRSTS